jgi:hypothetical protein
MLVRDPSGREGLVPTTYLQLDALFQQVCAAAAASCILHAWQPRSCTRGFIPQLFVQSLAVNMIAGPQQS